VVQLASQVGQFVIEQLHDMEVIEHNRPARKVLGYGPLVGWIQVDGDHLDPGLGGLQGPPGRFQGIDPLTLAHEQDPAWAQVNDDGERAMPFTTSQASPRNRGTSIMAITWQRPSMDRV